MSLITIYMNSKLADKLEITDKKKTSARMEK